MGEQVLVPPPGGSLLQRFEEVDSSFEVSQMSSPSFDRTCEDEEEEKEEEKQLQNVQDSKGKEEEETVRVEFINGRVVVVQPGGSSGTVASMQDYLRQLQAEQAGEGGDL